MLPFDVIPYELIGFVVFWAGALVTLRIALMFGRVLMIRFFTRVVNLLWYGNNPSEGETPDGWRHVAAFYAHVGLKLSKLQKPIAWRWKTYKRNVLID